MSELKQYISILIVLYGFQISAQTVISGHVSMEDKNSFDQKIFLSKVHFQENGIALQKITYSTIDDDGSFSFKGKHISDNDAVYRLYGNRMDKSVDENITEGKDFIMNNSDKIYFPKNKNLFEEYRNTNRADLEWKKMKRFQENLIHNSSIGAEDTISEAYTSILKSYTKDSLKILLVKLIGVRQLNEKGLLDKDVSKNPEYYLALLTELKESDIHPSQFQFLSRKLAYLTQEELELKYLRSIVINIFFGMILVGLPFLFYHLKKKYKVVVPNLSNQEQNIHTLIMEGKSNKEIAEKLFISVSTVKTHITNIYGKLKVSNRKELVERY